MREGVRLPAVVIVIGLLAGCSDPAGAVRRERAAARRSSPSPTAKAAPTASSHRTATWWQAPGHLKTANGLRVRTGALRAGRMRVSITDVAGKTARTITATAQPHGTTIGGFMLSGIRVAKSPRSGVYGVTFHYHR